MKVINPTDKSITIRHLGVDYTIEAESSLSNVPAETAKYWKESLHNFVEVEEDIEEVEKIIEETKEKSVVSAPEVKEEKPKAKSKK